MGSSQFYKNREKWFFRYKKEFSAVFPLSQSRLNLSAIRWKNTWYFKSKLRATTYDLQINHMLNYLSLQATQATFKQNIYK